MLNPKLTAEQYYAFTIKRLTIALAALAASIPVVDETPAGAIDGVNVVFTTPSAYSKLWVYYNGQRLHTTDDFTLTSPNSFTFVIPPVAGDKLRVDYILA